MPQKISSALLAKLKDVETLGSFSPESFHIFLDNPCPPTINSESNIIKDLPQDAKITLIHEYNHLVIYLTTYIGLKHFCYWVRDIGILKKEMGQLTDEEHVSNQSIEILSNGRKKQILSIDDDYYYEVKPWLWQDAEATPTKWTWSETSGALFYEDGKISPSRFWALRFFLGPPHPDMSNSFVRIPIGVRTILEHLAKACDFYHEVGIGGGIESTIELFAYEAFLPDLLHYYALTHRVSSSIEKVYGKSEIFVSFFLTGQLIAILSEIPFDRTDVWEIIVQYAKKVKPHFVPSMQQPHPSYIFPVLLHAACHSDIDINDFGYTDKMESVAAAILSTIGLKHITEYSDYKADLINQINGLLSKSEIGRKLNILIDGMRKCIEGVAWGDRFVWPAKYLTGKSPVPVLFGDGHFINGEFLNLDDVYYLNFLSNRRNEMLRYPFTRNLIEY